MRRTAEHLKEGIFVAEGEKVVRRLVESNLQIVSMLLTEEWFAVYSDLLTSREIEDYIFVGDKSLLETIVGYGLHQGIMAIGRVPRETDVFAVAATSAKPKLFVALDGIANSENMGVIIRNCAAFGVNVVISGETSCDPYLRRAVRNSMGTIFRLPVTHVEDLSQSLRKLRDEFSFHIVGADPKFVSVNVDDANLAGDVCLVLGSEGDGISNKVRDMCTLRVKIPMWNEVDSINVSSSVAVLLFEVSRRKSCLNNRL